MKDEGVSGGARGRVQEIGAVQGRDIGRLPLVEPVFSPDLDSIDHTHHHDIFVDARVGADGGREMNPAEAVDFALLGVPNHVARELSDCWVKLPVPRITSFYFRKELVSLHSDVGGLYIVELREILFQIGIALRLDQTLVWGGCTFAVFGIKGIHDFHALHHLAKRREAA